AQRVANGRPQAALDGLRVEPAESIGECFALELEALGSLKTFPEHCVCPFANGRAAPASRPAGYVHQPPAAGLTSCGLVGAISRQSAVGSGQEIPEPFCRPPTADCLLR